MSYNGRHFVALLVVLGSLAAFGAYLPKQDRTTSAAAAQPAKPAPVYGTASIDGDDCWMPPDNWYESANRSIHYDFAPEVELCFSVLVQRKLDFYRFSPRLSCRRDKIDKDGKRCRFAVWTHDWRDWREHP